jgi:hypothetical protein
MGQNFSLSPVSANPKVIIGADAQLKKYKQSIDMLNFEVRHSSSLVPLAEPRPVNIGLQAHIFSGSVARVILCR